MKSVIVLGNGFDIDLGLKTSFSEFINSYEFRSLSDIPLIVYIRKNLKTNLYGVILRELLEFSCHHLLKIQIRLILTLHGNLLQ